MLRLALTYQLILAVAVGPLLCCCSVEKLLASPPRSASDPASLGQSRVRGSEEPVPRSCCSHKHKTAPVPSGEKSAPSKPDAPADKCPCKDGSDHTPTTQAESSQAGTSTALRFLALDSLGAYAAPGVGELASFDVGGPADAQCLDHFFSTATQLLYAHHNLRC